MRKQNWLSVQVEEVIPPYGAIVMATGIVGIGLFNDGQILIAEFLLVFCGLLWLFFLLVVGIRAFRYPERFWRETKQIGALTSIAGTAVFGTKLVIMTPYRISYILLIIAILIWLFLIPINIKNLDKPTTGSSLLLTVSTESISVLMTTIAVARNMSWLIPIALLFSFVGVGFYLLVFRYFDIEQLVVGQGDHWILGGALAISTLAAAKGANAVIHFNLFPDYHPVVLGVAYSLWGITMILLPVLVFYEIKSPRFFYNLRRWSTIFPLGMYSACSFAVFSIFPKFTYIKTFAEYWVWVAFIAWIIVALSMFISSFKETRK